MFSKIESTSCIASCDGSRTSLLINFSYKQLRISSNTNAISLKNTREYADYTIAFTVWTTTREQMLEMQILAKSLPAFGWFVHQRRKVFQTDKLHRHCILLHCTWTQPLHKVPWWWLWDKSFKCNQHKIIRFHIIIIIL